MTLPDFLNALKVLRSIDRDELVQSGVRFGPSTWDLFRDYPYHWLIGASPDDQAAVWRIIEARMGKGET